MLPWVTREMSSPLVAVIFSSFDHLRLRLTNTSVDTQDGVAVATIMHTDVSCQLVCVHS